MATAVLTMVDLVESNFEVSSSEVLMQCYLCLKMIVIGGDVLLRYLICFTII